MNINVYGIVTANLAGKDTLLAVLNDSDNDNEGVISIQALMEYPAILKGLTNTGCICVVDDIGYKVPVIVVEDYSHAKDSDGEELLNIDLTRLMDKVLTLEIKPNSITGAELNLNQDYLDELYEPASEYEAYLNNKFKLKFELGDIIITPKAKKLLEQFQIATNFSMNGVTTQRMLSASDPMYVQLSEYKRILADISLAETRTGEDDYTEPNDYGEFEIIPEFYVPPMEGLKVPFSGANAKYEKPEIFISNYREGLIKKEDMDLLFGSYANDSEEFEPFDNEKRFYNDMISYIDYEIEIIKNELGVETVSGTQFREYGVLYKYLRYAIFCALKANWGYTGNYASYTVTADDIKKSIKAYKTGLNAIDSGTASENAREFKRAQEILDAATNSDTRYLSAKYDNINVTKLNNITFDGFIDTELTYDIYFQAKVLIQILRSGKRRQRNIYLPSANKNYNILEGTLDNVVSIGNAEPVLFGGRTYKITGEILTYGVPLDKDMCNILNVNNDNVKLNGSREELLTIGYECIKQFKSSKSESPIEVVEYFSIFDIAEKLVKEGKSDFVGIEYEGGAVKFDYDGTNQVDVLRILQYKNTIDLTTKPRLYFSETCSGVTMNANFGVNHVAQLEMLSCIFNDKYVSQYVDPLKMCKLKELKVTVFNKNIPEVAAFSIVYLLDTVKQFMNKYKEVVLKYNTNQGGINLHENLLNLAILCFVETLNPYCESIKNSSSSINKINVSQSFSSKIVSSSQPSQPNLSTTDKYLNEVIMPLPEEFIVPFIVKSEGVTNTHLYGVRTKTNIYLTTNSSVVLNANKHLVLKLDALRSLMSSDFKNFKAGKKDGLTVNFDSKNTFTVLTRLIENAKKN